LKPAVPTEEGNSRASEKRNTNHQSPSKKNNRVKNLNLLIQQGEFVTMLSPSGSGKTTCLMKLAGFETVTHGQI
jgi:ABC-type Fe3+/spermidine/putrescine transport system ATPase subunit